MDGWEAVLWRDMGSTYNHDGGSRFMTSSLELRVYAEELWITCGLVWVGLYVENYVYHGLKYPDALDCM